MTSGLDPRRKERSPAYQRGFLLLCVIALMLQGIGCNGSDAVPAGAPHPDQERFDPYYYDLSIQVEPEQQHVRGAVRIYFAVLDSLSALRLDLDSRMEVELAHVVGTDAQVRRDGRHILIDLPEALVRGDTTFARVEYSGSPRVAPNPPWDGGFTWAQTADGHPWFATSNQLEGASLWWPVQDYPASRPDSMTIRLTVPQALTGLANGELRGVSSAEGWTTTHWRVSYPIQPYAVAVTGAPYDRLSRRYTDVNGIAREIIFWVLPDDAGQVRAFLPRIEQKVAFLEEQLGPYPFWEDKMAFVQAPFLGMEHQTLIAYGGDFTHGGLGYAAPFDALLLHELAHEWFGNAVTVSSWKHLWLHEGFATYVEAMYARERAGEEGYQRVISHFQTQYGGTPIVGEKRSTLPDVYSRDVYFGGALVLHSLAQEAGNEKLTEILAEWIDAKTNRLVETRDFTEFVAEYLPASEFENWCLSAEEYGMEC